jgi:carboxyl-terminal processing protease
MTNNNLKRYKGFLIVVVLLLVSFGLGNYVGQKGRISNNSNPSLNITGNTGPDDASSTIDMSEFWQVWNTLDQKFVYTQKGAKVISAQDKLYGAIQGMTAAYGDPYTVFMPPTESQSFNSNIEGNFGGVGMELGIKDGNLVVISPLKGTPADLAGVKSGDVLVAINGSSTANMSTDDAVDLIRGEVGTPVTITLSRVGKSAPFDVKIVRAVINIPSIDTATKGDIFVISLYNFYAPSDNDFRTALRQFAESGKTKLILDLRGNPGGYLDSAVDMASFFLPLGKTVVTESYGPNIPDDIYRSKGYDVFGSNLKMMILVDQGTASAAEILSGALQENGIAKLVGTRTFGKGCVQELLPMSSSTSLKVTVARWLTPNGTSISDNGLTPDYPVAVTDADIAAGKDPQMAKAISLLDGTNN